MDYNSAADGWVYGSGSSSVHDTGAGYGHETDSGSGAGPLYDSGYGSGAGSAYDLGYDSGAGSAYGPGYASRTGFSASLPRVGDGSLRNMCPPGLSEEWKDWYEGFLAWRIAQIRFKTNGGYTVKPPPYHLRGDPNVVIKIKAPHWELGVYLRNVEDAVEFYNKNNPGCEIEPVEVLSGKPFYSKGVSVHHINFKAKPKTANSHDDCALTFFAELSFGPPVNMSYNNLPAKKEVHYCCLLEEGSTGDSCGRCPPECGVHHPLKPSAYKAGHPAFLNGPPKLEGSDPEFLRNCKKRVREYLDRRHATGR